METISFARGIPAPECLPVEELADCARAAIERDGRDVLSYGAGGGYPPLREWLGERHGVDPGRVLVTNGSLQGFVFLARRFAGERRVLVEAPTYDRPLKLLRELGADVVAIPQDDDGLDVDALEDELAAAARRSSTRSRPSRTRAGARSRPSAGAASSSLRASTSCSSSRTTRTGSSASRASRCRPCSSSPAASASSTARRSRRRSRPACASATSSCPRRSPRELEALAVRRTSRRRCWARRRSTSSCAAARSSRTSSACAACCARGATRCSPRSSGARRTGAAGAGPRAATSSGSTCGGDDARELLGRAEQAGVTFVKGADFFPPGERRRALGRGSRSASSRRPRSTEGDRAPRRAPSERAAALAPTGDTPGAARCRAARASGGYAARRGSRGPRRRGLAGRAASEAHAATAGRSGRVVAGEGAQARTTEIAIVAGWFDRSCSSLPLFAQKLSRANRRRIYGALLGRCKPRADESCALCGRFRTWRNLLIPGAPAAMLPGSATPVESCSQA